MPGGILQISSISTESLFLNGTPEITFFKTIYRRHTNFSIESIPINFDDTVQFNSINTVKIEQTGDLMHNVYLQVYLPQINLFRTTLPDPTEFQILYNTTVTNYNTTTNFMQVNRDAYVKAYNIFIAENNAQNATADMIAAIKLSFSKTNVKPMQDLLISTPKSPFTYNEISMLAISEGFDASSSKDALFKALSIGIDKSVKTQKFFYYQMYDADIALQDATNKHIKFAWVKRIGHFIAEYIDVKIGGHSIDKQYGSWINIWYELTANRNIEETYFKLIGNVSELTTFNREVKPAYILKIPLNFWFCRFSGLAIPIITLEYHNVTFEVNFRSFQELCYIESGTLIEYSLSPGGVTLEEAPDIIPSITLNANLLIDFYYLDTQERKRFAQSSHEYLIEQVQMVQTPNITQQSIQVLLNNFVHPTKEVIWIAQNTSYTMNNDGTNECRWDNYSMDIANIGNPVAFSSMDFNSYKRVMRLDQNYFNYVVPYEVHNTTPSDGINVYSFSLFPEDFQPSGTANFSKISRIILYLEFNQKLFTNGIIKEPLIVTTFTRNVNILRMLNGFGALCYTYLQ